MDANTQYQRDNAIKVLSEELDNANKKKIALSFASSVSFTITDNTAKAWCCKMLNEIGNEMCALEYMLNKLSAMNVNPTEEIKKIENVIPPPTESDKMVFDAYKNYVITNLSKQDQQRHFSNAMDHFMRTDSNWFNLTSTMRAISQHGDIHDDINWATPRDTISNSAVFQSWVKQFI